MALTIDHIFALYETKGGLTYGEDMSQVEHALQCAECAKADGAAESLIVACLLHDIGHLFEDEAEVVEGLRDDRHEATGAARLDALFGAAVSRPVALHVAAKRYLCAREPGYCDALSAASKASLALQGGPFEAAQAARFETLPYWREAVQLRRYDDLGKVVGRALPDFASYRPIVERAARVAG
ncbi:HD domain-containing protein [Phenylobacterium montanum]|uniref:Metal-dependent phosphohydrolase n=1 Tax=Phenylobacterium montanum TaxID=2823693 RepID=A0A975FYQ3_9CAUL|nr:metal-dependent phosphohydrolase [Caulobacter sp. S6]QUD87634.1 metal-dependent phosphohydrolase [Caulobacter sp. S6]